MPDAVAAHESVWLPYIRDMLVQGVPTVAIGHSSGAVALMRYAERYPLEGLVLVSGCVTDLGDAGEREAGYYGRPWQWENIRHNCGWIVQFHSDNDPFIPLEGEANVIAEGLALEPGVDYHVLKGRSHFFTAPFPELLTEIKSRM
jgi:predicted alpha/beta hydrolase family esterase